MASMNTAEIQANHSHSAFYVGDWYIDPNDGSITREGDTTRVEPKVMDVLLELTRHPGEVVTREDLERTVWVNTVISYDVLSSTMLKLRKAFHDNPKHPQIIETIPKKGYRLIAPVRPANEPANSRLRQLSSRALKLKTTVLLKYTNAILLLLTGISIYLVFVHTKPDSAVEPVQNNVSIVVLPFQNLNSDAAQEYFVDGMTNGIITYLTRLSDLFVISRDSAFVYKRSSQDIAQIARKLHVQYVLHGSLLREEQRLRINVILTDASNGTHIWAERYEGSTQNVFDFQDRICREIVRALAIKLTPAERQNLVQIDTRNMAAYEYFLRGTEHFFQYARNSNQEAREFFIKTIELDDQYARAYAMLGWTHAFDFMNGWSDLPDRSLLLGEQYASKAIEIEKNLPVAYFVRGLIYRERGEYQKALKDAEHAVRLDPSYANGHVLHATLLYYTGHPQEGLLKIQRAIRLNPHHPFNYPFHLGQAYFILHRYSEAIHAFKTGLASNPSSERLRVWLAASYAQNGQLEDAQWQMDQIKLVNPGIKLENQIRAFPFKQPSDLGSFIDGLKMAGLSE